MTDPAPSHPDVEFVGTTTVAARHLRIEVDVQLALLRAVRFHGSTILRP